MARIRTVKPELFEHEELFDLERETGLPLRLAFIGLFTCCDREGRFKWRPRTLKLSVLPHDEIDFARVLDALATRDFVRKYEFDGVEYGVIPTFYKHQVINNRESPSDNPAPTETSYISITSTREARVDDAITTPLVQDQVERKGMEGNGTGKEGVIVAFAPSVSQPNLLDDDETDIPATGRTDPNFEIAWTRYPKRKGGNPKNKALQAWQARLREGCTADEMIAGADRYCAYCKAVGYYDEPYAMQAKRFFGTEKGFSEDWSIPTAKQANGRPSINAIGVAPGADDDIFNQMRTGFDK